MKGTLADQKWFISSRNACQVLMRRSSLFVSSSAFNTWLLSAQGERGKGNLFKNSSLRDAGSARGRHFCFSNSAERSAAKRENLGTDERAS